MRSEVIRSPRRRKTVQARLVDGVVQVTIPARMSRAEEEKWVTEMVGRFERKQATEPIDLAARAEILAVRHGLEQPDSIRWVDNQEWRWGSCTPADRSIRLSTRLAGFPFWVVDYVLVHELAHLTVAGHGRDFWALVERYPRTERARGFLIAMGFEGATGSDLSEARQPSVARKAAHRSPTASEQRTLW